MQVLIENPFAPMETKPRGLIKSFWSENTYFMDATFSMSSLMTLTEKVGLSPYAVLDAKIAILIAQLSKGMTVLTQNIGPLAVIVTQFDSLSVSHDEDQKKVDNYRREYLPKNGLKVQPTLEFYDQIMTYGKNDIDPELWKKLRPGGLYLLGVHNEPINLTLDPKEYSIETNLTQGSIKTNFGIRFDSEEFGLEKFEISKIKKIF